MLHKPFFLNFNTQETGLRLKNSGILLYANTSYLVLSWDGGCLRYITIKEDLNLSRWSEVPAEDHDVSTKDSGCSRWGRRPSTPSRERPAPSQHGGLRLQDGLCSGVPGQLGGVFSATAADGHGVQSVVPPHIALEGETPPGPPQLALNLTGEKHTHR